ncbi:hypothetical protein OO013_08300 [Mangrovivirga sp. M17]|uniref:Lipoprotein n=1 Tax=Mangrovivirga halotolerans TaxID=2993936 RepID=A0ABT3RR67_9BACT|nr:hypothetical protein [Mangrovivirga halotolerans]MCX2743863.1 hypothetical protein [Mangrovivirga halotolerans]
MKRIICYSLSIIFILILIWGCKSSGSSATDDKDVIKMSLATLNIKSRPLDLGNIGQVYRLQNPPPEETRLEVKNDISNKLLPKTIRLFRYVESDNLWVEIKDSYYDAEKNELVGNNLKPGLYTASGWSSNPAANAMQRMIYDLSKGFEPIFNEDQLYQDRDNSDLDIDYRTTIVQNWISYSVNLKRITCETIDSEECDDSCGRSAGRTKLSSCPEECPEPECCECIEFTWPEKILIPVSFLDIQDIPLPRPICPYGLSCPTNSDNSIIKPTLDVPDYSFMKDLGMARLINDAALRDNLHQLTEVIIGKEYPVPPPWPNYN